MAVKAGDTAYWMVDGGQETVMVHDVDYENWIATVEIVDDDEHVQREANYRDLRST
jgi:hypothetical protein